MYYPEWKETREGMWAAELKFPMIDEETPTFMGRPHASDAKSLAGADVVIIGAPYVSSKQRGVGRGRKRALAGRTAAGTSAIHSLSVGLHPGLPDGCVRASERRRLW